MYCKKCGKECSDSAKFCGNCGQPFNDESTVATPINANTAGNAKVVVRRSKPMIIFGIIFILAAAISLYFFYQGYENAERCYYYYIDAPDDYYLGDGMFKNNSQSNLQGARTRQSDMQMYKTLMIVVSGGCGAIGILLICLGAIKKPRYK